MCDEMKSLERYIKLGMLLCTIFCAFLIGNRFGLDDGVSKGLVKLGKNIAGYEERITMTKTQGREPIPILGSEYIEQDIYIGENVVKAGKMMLEIDVANYVRINHGELYVDIKQGEVVQTYVTDVSKITEDKTIRLVVDMNDYKEGEVSVKFYAPAATSDNCIAVFVINDLEVYKELNHNGTFVEKNACIDLAIPANHVRADFVFLKGQ